jgi:hypothetical protein
MSIEAIKQALDALSYVMSHGAQVQIAKDILTEAIEQAEQKTEVSPGKGTGFIARALGITVLQPALETKQKTAVSPDPDDPGVTFLYTAPVDGVTISEERVDETAERKHMTDLASVGEVGVWGEREWVGLTEWEIEDLYFCKFSMSELKSFGRAIENRLREKNT